MKVRTLRSGEAKKLPFTTLEDRYYRMKVREKVIE